MALPETTNLITIFFAIVSVIISFISMFIFLKNYWIIEDEKLLVDKIFFEEIKKDKLMKLSKNEKANMLNTTFGEISINRYVKDKRFRELIDYFLLTNIKK